MADEFEASARYRTQKIDVPGTKGSLLIAECGHRGWVPSPQELDDVAALLMMAVKDLQPDAHITVVVVRQGVKIKLLENAELAPEWMSEEMAEMMLKHDVGVTPLIASVAERENGSPRVLNWCAAQRYLASNGWQNIRSPGRSAEGETPALAVKALVEKLRLREVNPADGRDQNKGRLS